MRARRIVALPEGFAMSEFQFNERGMRKLFKEITAKFEAADENFRRTHTGLPYEVVRADAAQALPAGVELGDADLDKYAAAVASGQPFEFRLR